MIDYIQELSEEIINSFMDPARIPYAIAASLLVVVIGVISGALFGRAIPLYWIVFDKLFGGVGERLDRPQRAQVDLMFRGFLLSAVVLFISLLLGKGAVSLIVSSPLYGVYEVLILSLLLSVGTVWKALWALYRAQEKGGQAGGAFYTLSRSANRNLTAGDDLSMTRIAMGYAARSFDKQLVAPIFWYLLLGLPAALFYSALAMLSWRFGKDGFTKGFGIVPLVLERLMGAVPSMLSALLMTMSGGFSPSANISKGLGSLLDLKGRAPYEQGGATLSAMSWSLNVTLGGASQDLSGSPIKGVWVGPEGASAKTDHHHLRRALFMCFNAYILFMAALCGSYLWAGDSTLFERIMTLIN